MNATSALKSFRDNDYAAKPKDAQPGGPGDDKPETKTRTLHLTDDEQKLFPPGEVTCQVTGRVEEDGRLTVSSLAPAQSPEMDMAGQVASKVDPNIKGY